ncbi:hypothetical protein HanRHA438_Chr16g0759561 [Helianthus annuus]|nr:hypothetical protein HanIR_Chr16g0812741 [Helianthus annuus]KAJ0835803.1 hypothetical protein HanRHA438_Chr16g0759561 [Helianthus annuus]
MIVKASVNLILVNQDFLAIFVTKPNDRNNVIVFVASERYNLLYELSLSLAVYSI